MPIRLQDIPFCGEFTLVDVETGIAFYDSHIDGHDVSSLITLCPVVSVSIENGNFRFTVQTKW